MKTKTRTRLVVAGAAVALTLGACGAADDDGSTASAAGTGGSGESDAPSIALSNGFIGNSWRQTLVRLFEQEADKLVDEGTLSSYQVVNAPGENSASEQASQIRSLILQEPDALLVIPASPTGLNPVMEEACAAGIEVVVVDSESDLDCVTVVRNAYDDWGDISTTPVLEAIGGEGTVVNNRGVVGSQPEELFYQTQQEILDEHPGVEVAAEINGFCDAATTQQELVSIMASLPEIDGVMGCSAGLGVAQAFESAGRDIPVVVFDTNGQSLQYWKDEGIDNGSYATLTDPGQAVAAMWVALELLAGNDVPDELILPLLQITEEDRDAWLETLGPDEYAAYTWTKDLVLAQIEAVTTGGDPVIPPSPAND